MSRSLGLVVLLSAIFSPLPCAEAQAAGLTARGPISILGNGDFRPENGVVNGSGASWDPFIIEGWDIQFHGAPQDAYDPRAGIFIRNTDAHFVLRNLRVAQTAERDGIKLQELKNGHLERVEVTGSRTGIHIEKTTTVIVESSNIHDNAAEGIVVIEGSDHAIHDNRIEANLGAEVRVQSTDRDQFLRNTVRATRGASGLDAKHANGFVARDNHFTATAGAEGGTGVWFEGVTRGVFTGNEVRDFADDGLVVHRSSGGELRNNVLTGNGHRTHGAGLRIHEASEARATQNQILGNAGPGAALEGASRVTLSDNLLKDNKGPGVDLTQSSYNLIRNNTVTGSGGPGLVLRESSHNDVQANMLRENRAAGRGAIVVGGNDNYVANNQVRANEGAGILIEIWMAGNEIVRNDVRDNSAEGVLSLAARQRNTIRDNTGTVRYDEEAEKRAVPTGETPLPFLAPIAILLAALTRRASPPRVVQALQP